MSKILADDVTLRLPINALVSYHYFKKKDIAELRSWGLRLIGDSGAFSAMNLGAEISLDEFLEWGLAWKKDLAWVASLDVIGNEKESWNNFQALRAGGLDAIPTIHYGEDPKTITKYAELGVDFMGLGGMVGRKSEVQRLLRWTLSVFRYARDNHPEMRFHGWGVTHSDLVMNLPWYSVDSSGFSSSYRFARLALFNPATGKNVGIALDGKDIFNHGELLRKEYGIDPEAISVSNRETRRPLVRTSVLSVQKMEDFLRQRHQVSAPNYGLNKGLPTGAHAPNLHVVLGAPRQWQDEAIHSGPNVHVALGFPGAQSTISMNPADQPPQDGPHVHVVDNALSNFYDMSIGNGPGPHVHVVDKDSAHLKIMGEPGPNVHVVTNVPGYLKDITRAAGEYKNLAGPKIHVVPAPKSQSDFEHMTAKETK